MKGDYPREVLPNGLLIGIIIVDVSAVVVEILEMIYFIKKRKT